MSISVRSIAIFALTRRAVQVFSDVVGREGVWVEPGDHGTEYGWQPCDATCDGTELIEDPTFVFFGCNPMASPQGYGVFLPCQLSHETSSTNFGKRIYEASRDNLVTVSMKQIASFNRLVICVRRSPPSFTRMAFRVTVRIASY